MLAIVVSIGLVTGILAFSAHEAEARNTCRARNATHGTRTRSDLQAVIDAARPRDLIRVKGVCSGRPRSLTGSDRAASGFRIGKDLTIVGLPTSTRPQPVLRVIGDGRVLFVAAHVTLTNLRISGGSHRQFGGGIFNRGILTLNGTVVSGNSADFGGGISSSGFLSLNDSTVRGNRARGGGGGINNESGRITLNGSSSVRRNHGGYGGGIVNFDGTLILNDSSLVRGNSSSNHGGGISNDFGILTLNDSASVRGNTNKNGGGGISNSVEGTVTLNDSSSVRGNTTKRRGGGIYNDVDGTLTLKNSSSVKRNTANLRGGIFNAGNLRACDNTGVDEWTGAISPNNPDDPPVVTLITC
jgi:hypothetical protein